MIINIIWDTSVNGAPAGFQQAVQAVVSYYQGSFTDDITFNLNVGYGTINGAPLNAGNLGQSQFTAHEYSTAEFIAALEANASTANDFVALNGLPSGGQLFPATTDFWVMDPLAAALGLLSPDEPIDMYIGFSSAFAFDYDRSDGITAGQYDFMGTVAHELTEVMGRVLGAGEDIIAADGTGDYMPLDLFHWTTSGGGVYLRDFDRGGYFSIDRGVTPLAYFNPQPTGDSGDWGGLTTNDAYLASSNPGVYNQISPADLIVMDVLGYRGYTDDYGEDVNFAWNISAGQPAKGSIELLGDADWFRMQLTAGKNYTISVRGFDGGGGTLEDPFLAVWDRSSKFLTSDNDSGRGRDGFLTFTPTETDYYYIAVSSYFGQGTGTYEVVINTGPKVIPPTIRLPVELVSDKGFDHLPTFLGGKHYMGKADVVLPPVLVETTVPTIGHDYDSQWLFS